ncbi:TetR family transcriptional regulator [Streptomyces sp. NPDC048717]|uniref:TetR/AcrR family transcriptional regulator n=1 Tax=Streptomyces sp. NPDC048717 TaxID=3154928 RepID=UPI003441D9B4
MTSVRRSDATRSAIVEAARERFAADGYERATIRAIARDAGIDPSMVMRYYGNKAGLFAAATTIELEVAKLVGLPASNVGTALVEHFLDRWERDEVLTGLLRAGVTNAAGNERMREIFTEQLVSIARETCPDPAEAPRRAALVASQILGMALARYVLGFAPAAEMSRAEVVVWLGPTIQRYLTAEAP